MSEEEILEKARSIALAIKADELSRRITRHFGNTMIAVVRPKRDNHMSIPEFVEILDAKIIPLSRSERIEIITTIPSIAELHKGNGRMTAFCVDEYADTIALFLIEAMGWNNAWI
jgi:hypothetical protein